MTAQNASDNALHVIQLAEFGMHDFTCETAISDADLSAGLVMTRVNNACQQLLPSKCRVDEWYDGVTCQSRARYLQPLLIQPNMLQVRFLDEPQGSVTWHDYSVNGTSSTLLREFNYHVMFVSNGVQSVHVLGMQEVRHTTASQCTDDLFIGAVQCECNDDHVAERDRSPQPDCHVQRLQQRAARVRGDQSRALAD